MTRGLQRVMAWCGPAFLLLMFGGCIIAGLLPPPAPGQSAEQAATFWATDPGSKRFGMVIVLVSACLQIPFGALIATRIKQLEGRFSPLAYVQIAAVILSVLSIIIPAFGWVAASYRPERDHEITQALNDFSWIMFVMNWPGAVAQVLAVGIAIMRYRGTQPIWPRWFGYYNLWTAFLFLGGGLTVMFKDSVFAWNGLITCWTVAALFGVWFCMMTWQLLATVRTPPAVEQPELVLSMREASIG